MGFTMILHGEWPTGDLIGMAVGHVYYFFDEVWPRIPLDGRSFVRGGEVVRPRVLRGIIIIIIIYCYY